MSSSNKERRDVAAEISALIIRKLEEGTAPWSRPWRVASGGRPLRHEGTAYRGINAVYLWAVADDRGYRSRYWMTYRQAEALGGQVRRGEAGSLSIYYSSISRTELDPRTGEEAEKTMRFPRHYVVFNADQIDGLPDTFRAREARESAPPVTARHAAVDGYFAAIPAEVRHGGNSAYFSPTFDYIQLPARSAFHSPELYASTRAHETVHWSGAPTRLARSFGKRFADKAYAFEELVAEIGAGFVCAELGLPNELHDSHASYLRHWLGILKADKSAIIHAAGKAEQAVAYLAGFAGDAALPGREAADACLAASERRAA